MKPEIQNLDAFMAENLQEFKPFAYFDNHMDCIRVKFLDCSVTEERLNKFLTVLTPNHRDYSGHVGFTLKGIAHLFNKAGLSRKTAYHLADILDAIVKAFPDENFKKLRSEIETNEAAREIPAFALAA